MKKDDIDHLVANGVLQKTPDKKLLKTVLNDLIKDGFIQNLPNEFFAFNNNLTWEVIYETLLFSERRHLHSLVAKHIEHNNSETLESVSDLLLHHYDEANDWEKAVYYAAISGDRAAKMYAIEDAVSLYQRVLGALEKVHGNYNVDICLTYERIGDIFLTSGHDEQASEAFKNSLETFHNKLDNKNRLTPWKISKNTQEPSLCRKIAMSYQGLASYDVSLEWLDKAIDTFPQRPGKLASQIYASKSGTYYRKGQLQDALEWGNKALKIAKKLKSNEDIAYACKILANSYKWAGKSHEAIELLKSAIQSYEELEDLVGLSTSYINLGVCYHLVSELDLANSHYETALKYCKRIHNESLAAMVHNNLGEVFFLRGILDKAVHHFNATIQSYEQGKSEKPLAGLALVNICRCDRARNNLESAEKHLVRGRSLLKEVGSDALMVESDLDLAELYIDQKKYEEATKLSETNLSSLVALDFAPLTARGKRIMANVLANNGDIDKSLSLLMESIKLAKEIDAEHEEAKSIMSYAKICIDNERSLNKLNIQLNRAITILKEIGAENDLKEARYLSSKLK